SRHLQEGVNGLSALIETLLRELPPPGRSEIGRLHRAFAALLDEICCISCHCLLPRRSAPLSLLYGTDDVAVSSGQRVLPHLVPATRKSNARTVPAAESARNDSNSCGCDQRQSALFSHGTRHERRRQSRKMLGVPIRFEVRVDLAVNQENTGRSLTHP